MKVFFKNLIILLVSIIAAGTIIIISCTSIVFNKEEVKNVVSKSGLYEKMNNDAKKIAIEALDESLNEVDSSYNINIKAEDLLKDINITDIFELLTNQIVDIAYSEDEPKLVIDYLTNRYIEELDSYLKKNKIKLPDEVNKTIHESLSEEKLDKLVKDTDVIETVKDIQEIHIKIEELANIVVLVLLIIVAIPTLLIIILCKKKVKEMVKLLSLTSLILIGFEVFIRTASKNVTGELGELVVSLLNSTIKLLFDKIHMFLVVMFVLILILVAFKILTTKTPEEQPVVEQN